MTEFQKLSAIIGKGLTKMVCDRMGGTLVRIRKSPQFKYKRIAKLDKISNTGMETARLAGASQSYVSKLRRGVGTSNQSWVILGGTSD